jgi:5-dehydro-2-deoxygluconokinase
MGGLIAGLANCMTLEDSVVQGSACAALVVSRVACSTAMPFQAELSEFMKINTLSQI